MNIISRHPPKLVFTCADCGKKIKPERAYLLYYGQRRLCLKCYRKVHPDGVCPLCGKKALRMTWDGDLFCFACRKTVDLVRSVDPVPRPEIQEDEIPDWSDRIPAVFIRAIRENNEQGEEE